MKRIKCCLCGKTINGFGNNPYPLANEGQCCDDCNWNLVIPARVLDIYKKECKNG